MRLDKIQIPNLEACKRILSGEGFAVGRRLHRERSGTDAKRSDPMTQNAPCELRELTDADLPAAELKRLVRIDALLREVAARDRDAALATQGDARDCRRV